MSSDTKTEAALAELGLTEEMLVWLAIIRPLTRWADGRYGDLLDKATWMLAGPQGMKLASLRSRILWRLLWT